MVQRCVACNLSECSYQQINTSGNSEDCELLIVSDYPRADDDITGYPLSGAQYGFLWDLLNQVGVKYQVTDLIRCIPIDKYSRRYRKPELLEYTTCLKEKFESDVERLKPKCILALGQAALDVLVFNGYITDVEAKTNNAIKEFRESSHEFYTRGVNAKFLATYHPSYISSTDNEQVYTRFIEDVVYACRHAMKHRSDGVYKSITINVSQLERIVDIWCNDHNIEYVGFDTESNGLNPLIKGSKITSFSLCVDGKTGYNIFLYHPELPDITDDDRSRIAVAARKLLTTKKIVAHHAKHEHRFAKVFWGFTPNIIDDTMYMSYILFLAYPGIKHGLKFLAGRFLAMPPWEEYMDDYKEIFSALKRRKYLSDDKVDELVQKYKRHLGVTPEDIHRFWDIIKDPNYYIKQEESDDSDVLMWMVPMHVMNDYAGMDAIATLKLRGVFKPLIEADPGLTRAYSMMVKGAEAFANIELKGLRVVDIDRWTKIYQDKMDQNLQILRNFREVQDFERDNGIEYNPSSSKQNIEVFYERFKFPVKGTTGKGDPSTSETVLIDLIKEYREKEGEERKLGFLSTFREYKKLGKLMSAYLIGLRKFIHDNDAFDGRKCEYVKVPDGEKDMHIHPGYLLHTVETGRVASRDPSLHTIPAGSDIKRMLVSHWRGRGGLIVTADQSQLELRVLASIIERYYGDPSLAEAYRHGKDIHRFNASKVFARPEEDIVDSERRFAKTISFSLLYGSSEKSVAESTGRTADEVHDLFETFYAAFPGIKKYIESTHEYARQYGCVRTPMGRVKYVLAAQNPNDRGNYSAALRQAQNGIIQSSGSDLSFQSIVWMNDYFKENNLETQIVGFIHDSIELDAPSGEWFQAYDALKYSMKTLNESEDWVTCPLGIDVELATSMGDTVAVKDMTVHDDGSRTFVLKGYDYIIEDIIEESKYGYDIIEDEIIEQEEFFNRAGDLVARRALNLSFDDKTFNMMTRKVRWMPKSR